MDFFAYQDAARKRTSALVAFFVLAVALIIVSVYIVCVLVILILNAKGETNIALWQPHLFLWVSVVTAAVVLIGTLWKIFELRGGGPAIARMLGGRLIAPDTKDRNERKILNVVEEMAIASGIRVPPVYLLASEPRINAFAAGFSTADAGIGIPRGAIQNLSRDELQGVIGHEFSHILNGDMMLNIRLMGFLHGILLLAMIGYGVLRGASRVRGRNAGAVVLLGLVIGLSLMAIGWIGVFFGRLIKSAVSRQREFLADASSVQFTRNPGGITGALKKIGGMVGGSRLESSNAEDASHLFFGNGIKTSFFNLLSTHPPLDERIRRFDAQFDGMFPAIQVQEDGAAHLETPVAMEELAATGFDATAPVAFQPEQVVSCAGAVRPEQLAYAMQLVASLPKQLRNAVRDPTGAQAVVYNLLLDGEQALRERQLGILDASADPAVRAQTDKLAPETARLGPEARLPLLDMALPALRHLSAGQYRIFRDNICGLVEADQQIRLFEFTLNRILLRHLDPIFFGRQKKITQYYSLDPLRKECEILLSALAYVGAPGADNTQQAFGGAVARLGLPLELMPLERCDLGSIDQALDRLNAISAPLKKQLLEACAACVSFDGQVMIDEAELFRAIADSLDCPMPPFLG